MIRDELSLRLSRDCGVAPGAHVLCAVSGGADSMALLCLLLELRQSYPLTVSCAHMDHGIRGETSRQDAAFVSAFCEKAGVPLYLRAENVPRYARGHGCGLEDAARRLRYAFLYDMTEKIGADVIALAHHAHDQAETVLMHAARGSDMRGLCAMAFRDGRLIRPLLGCMPRDLRAYLASIGQSWREDETNADVRYARNRIRAQVMPALEAVNPGAQKALCRLARAAQRDEAYFERQIDALNLRVIGLTDGLAVRREAIASLHPALRSRVLVRLVERAVHFSPSAEMIEAIERLLQAGETGTVNLSCDMQAHVGKAWVCVVDPHEAAILHPDDAPLNVPGETETLLGRFTVREAEPGETGDGKLSQAVPLGVLSGATVGVRREGDVMIPFGHRSPVKLKKLMIDAGIERALRRSMPVIRKGDDVIFAVGLRPGEICRTRQEEPTMIVTYCCNQEMKL